MNLKNVLISISEPIFSQSRLSAGKFCPFNQCPNLVTGVQIWAHMLYFCSMYVTTDSRKLMINLYERQIFDFYEWEARLKIRMIFLSSEK